jgi:hypothetical protein
MSSNTSRDASPWNLSPDNGVAALSRALFEDHYYPYHNPMHQYFPHQYPCETSNNPDTLPSPTQSTDLTCPSNIYTSGFVGQVVPFRGLPLHKYTPCNHPESSTKNATTETLPSFFQISHYETSHRQPLPQAAIVPTRTTSHYRISKPRYVSQFLRIAQHSYNISTNMLHSTIPTIVNPMRCHWPGCRYAGSFSKKGQLTRHVKTQHISPKSFGCSEPGCGKAFHRKDNLGEHIRRIHLGKYNQVLGLGSHS